MDIQHLKYALEIHNCGSISKAAQNLFIAQPNLSNAIRDLEKELGITIFKRNPSGITTTDEGLEFLQYARTVVSRFDAMEKRYVKSGENKIKVSISTMRSSVMLHKTINYVNQKQSEGQQISINYRETTNMDALNDIISGVSDFGIIRANSLSSDTFRQLFESNQLTAVPLPSDCYILLMSAKHPLAKADIITVDMLEPYTEVLYADFEASWYPQHSAKHSISKSTPNKNAFYVCDRASSLEAIASIDGAYAWTTTSATPILTMYNFVEKYCSGFTLETREYLVYKQGAQEKKLISDLIMYLNTAN